MNYCYISEFTRYYFIEDIKQVDDGEEIIEEVKQELKNIINLNTTV